MARKRKKKAAPADVADVAEDAGAVPEFTSIRMNGRRPKYGTSLGNAHPGQELSLPWQEALVFIDRGWADEC